MTIKIFLTEAEEQRPPYCTNYQNNKNKTKKHCSLQIKSDRIVELPRRKSASSLSEWVGVGGPLAGSPSRGVGAEWPWQPSVKCEDDIPNEFMFFGSVATFEAGTAICEEESSVCKDCKTSCAGSSMCSKFCSEPWWTRISIRQFTFNTNFQHGFINYLEQWYSPFFRE